MPGLRDLRFYKMVYSLALQIFEVSRSFPKEERYGLTDQIRRSSRSVVANLAEGYRKKRYPKLYLSKLIEVDGELAETQVWIDFAYDFGYITVETRRTWFQGYEDAGRMLGGLIASAENVSDALSENRLPDPGSQTPIQRVKGKARPPNPGARPPDPGSRTPNPAPRE